MIQFDIALDLFPLLAATLAAVTCGLLGNFLLLRGQSLMGDAISHSVLPGLVVAFLITATRSPLVMFAGAALAGVVTVVLVELVKRLGRVEPGAAMGVVFSVLFALGVLLIEQAAVRHVDLDAECVLHGQLETLAWYGAPESLAGLFRGETLQAVPRQVTTLAVVCVLAFAFVGLLFKELRLAAFDPSLATTQGFHAGALHYALMVFVAAATVASFEAVGSILVIAMLICPAATARLLTDRLRTQVAWSVVVALLSGTLGYFAATSIPAAFGKDSVNAAGSMVVVAGGVLGLAVLAAPRHGLVAGALRRRRLARRIALEDLLLALQRGDRPAGAEGDAGGSERRAERRAARILLERSVSRARRNGWVEGGGRDLALTSSGRAVAEELLRRRESWETYLVEEAGLARDHVADSAEVLEHLTVSPRRDPLDD